MNTRGSANMWWIIIGAVIALVVMIVLMVIFTSKSGTLEQGLLSCESKGGECLDNKECSYQNKEGNVVEGTFTRFECLDTKQFCCFGVDRGE